MNPQRETVRLAAVADVHCTRTSSGALAPIFAEAASQADVLLLGGDLTDYGLPEEARVLARELSGVKIPMLGVLGNHDFESGHEEEIVKILVEAGVQMLDGDSVEVQGVGFVGVKGFCGGFGRRTLEPWGEAATKAFVHEAVGEALKLERALARLRTPQRVVLLHYAPIEGTVEGEPREIFPFLGSSRLEEPLNRYQVTVAFHGHAHRGAPEGRTSSGIPVFNVAMPLLRRTLSETLPVRIVEIPVLMPVSAGAEAPSRRRDDLH
ncbi:MAG TPA: metallophosphoesterase [Vicinamibacteria bacterium]|nr:metallophosphoesterase [Vicinamibacteria bacterium]